MKKLFYSLLIYFILVNQTLAATTQVFGTMPQLNENFAPDQIEFNRTEDAARFLRSLTGRVYSGGLGGAGIGLSHLITPLDAIGVTGYAIKTDGVVATYTDNRRTYVFASELDANPSNVTGGSGCTFKDRIDNRTIRVECAVGSALPTVTPYVLPIMYVDTFGGDITSVTDLRPHSAIPTVDTRFYSGGDYCAKIAAAAAATNGFVIIDARGEQGPQWCNTDPFAGYTDITLYVGNHTVTTTARWRPSSNTQIIGTRAFKLVAANSFGDVSIIFNSTSNPATENDRDENIYIKGITIDGNKANNASGTQFSHCIQFNAVLRGVVKDVLCLDPKGDGIYAGYGDGSSVIKSENIQFSFNVVERAQRNGISITGAAIYHISYNQIRASKLWGVDVEPDEDVADVATRGIISFNIITDGGDAAVWPAIRGGIAVVSGAGGGATLQSITHTIIQSNIIDLQNGHGIAFRSVSGLKIKDNKIRTTTLSCVGHLAGGIIDSERVEITNNDLQSCGAQGISYSGPEPIKVASNEIRSAVTAGIQVDNTEYADIIDNKIFSSGTDQILLQALQKSTISNNSIFDGASHGIRCLSSGGIHCETNKIGNNNIQDNTGTGIILGANSTGNMITGNKLAGNGVTITDSGTNPFKTLNDGYVTTNYITITVGNGLSTGSGAHGLAATPNGDDIVCSPLGDIGLDIRWWHSVSGANIVITTDAVVTGDKTWSCHADIR